MSGINRFLSRREKNPRDKEKGNRQEKPRQTAGYLHGLFSDHEEQVPEKDEEKKIKALIQRLACVGITTFKEPDINLVLNAAYAKGDPEKAFDLLVLLEESEEGIIKDYNPNVTLLGAVNRYGITCYLDATLFALFARLDSFEAILYNTFEDETRKKLATLLRLWVNTLRVGRLITVDITMQLQNALADCGWREAAERCQQDASEAFSFITEKLELPMLTLKMDIFHMGKSEADDDHRFVRERLLEVAIPEELGDGKEITLEDCLETYFNSRIEVKRYLERRGTLNSLRSRMSIDSSKGNALHIESLELHNSQSSTPLTTMPQSPLPPYSSRQRATSIIQENYISEKDEKPAMTSTLDGGSQQGRPRAGTLRKEVMMPAWQFFSLIPWYTDTMPSSDAQVAAHFSSKRPVLGICLKRYSMLANGQAVRRGTYVDIPLEIGLPHFIHDDTMSDDAAAFGNFKLSLQSVVCHRGESVDSGHYISLVRGQASNATGASGIDDSSTHDRWMLFDDLAKDRITNVDVEMVLRKESPYLLFYQVQPIDETPENNASEDMPPSYSSDGKDSGVVGLSLSTANTLTSDSEVFELTRPNSEGQNLEVSHRRSSMTSERRLSIAFTDNSTSSAKHEQATATLGGSLSSTTDSLVASRRGSKSGKLGSGNGQGSHNGDKRLSASLTRLANMLTKDKPDITIAVADPLEVLESQVSAVPAIETSRTPEVAKFKKDKKLRRLSGHNQLSKGKAKAKKPDRECILM